MEHVNCELCGASNHRPVMAARDLKYGTPGIFTIVRCGRCRLQFLDPRPSAEEIADYYPQAVVEYAAEATPNSFSRAEAKRVQEYRAAPGKVLDVGCATGYFLAAMRELGWSVSGVEPDPGAARRAATIPGAAVKQGMLEAGDFPEEQFDAVTLWSVLEHLHHPRETLSIIRRLLKPDGLLHLGLPNFGSLERRLFGTEWFGLDIPRHLYHFTPKSVRAMLNKAGFETVRIEHASGHDVFRFSIRLKLGKPLGGGHDGGVMTSVRRSHSTPHGRSKASFRTQMNAFGINLFTRVADRLGYGCQLLVVARPV